MNILMPMSKRVNICLQISFLDSSWRCTKYSNNKTRSQTYVKPQLHLLEIIFSLKERERERERERDILWSSFVQWNIHNLPIKQRWKLNVNYIKYCHQTQYIKLEWGEVLVNITKPYRGIKGKAPLNLNKYTKWRRAVNITSQLLSPAKGPHYQLYRGLDGSHT